jgi:predicted esterase
MFSEGVRADEPLSKKIESALLRAGDNRAQIQDALDKTSPSQQEGIRFLVAHMPDRDLTSVSSEFLLENVRVAYQSWAEAPWKDQLPKDVFLNNVLPYASINERRDNWRSDFRKRFVELVKDSRSPSAAAATLNQKIFPQLKVKYSTKRRKADQSPYESIESGLASCSGLSVLLVDACRSVGVPARFVGTPLWTNKSGNHSWVEIWDDGWHFTGAAEPTGDQLDRAWFTDRATTAQRDHPLHAIYAVSFKPTPQLFPLVWGRDIDYIFAVNVTDRYTKNVLEVPAGKTFAMFRVLEGAGQDRCSASIKVSQGGKTLLQGTSKDERFDANDHLTGVLAQNQEFDVEVRSGDRILKQKIRTGTVEKLFTFAFSADQPQATTPVDEAKSAAAIGALDEYLSTDFSKRGHLQDLPFATTPISRGDAKHARQRLWDDHAKRIRRDRAAEMKAGSLQEGDLKMPFFLKKFGKKPSDGWSLYISMHGGGGAPKAVNDRQWENQKRLYQLKEGIYLVPRAPTNTWNLWHQAHIDGMFERLIENLIVLEGVNPNRVYIMGYSAGGDGVFQLAPRMADRLAAAAMMAGHPNETSPLGLRNIGFALYMGGRDSAYNRNKVAADWEKKLADLQQADPPGYQHQVKIFPDKGHWMDREDVAALPWMARFKRNPLPEKIVWKQDDVTHASFYWLAVDGENRKARSQVIATRKQQAIDIEKGEVGQLIIRLNDEMLDLDQEVTISFQQKTLFQGHLQRTIGKLAETIKRGDPFLVFSAEISVELPKKTQTIEK